METHVVYNIVSILLAKNLVNCYTHLWMRTVVKFIAKIILIGGILYIANEYIDGFVLEGGIKTLIISAGVLAILSAVLRPILRFVTAPLVWITFGLFNICIFMVILWLGDKLLPSLTITGIKGLFLVSVMIFEFKL